MVYAEAKDKTKIWYYSKKARNNKPVLFFIHGFGLNNTEFKTVMKILTKKKYSVLAADLRGHGKSDRLNETKFYSPGSCAEDLNCVLAKTKTKSAVLVCHSLGGIVALKLCITHPEKVKSIVLFNACHTLKFKKPTLLYNMLSRHQHLFADLAYSGRYIKKRVFHESEKMDFDFTTIEKHPGPEIFLRGIVETGSSAKLFYDAFSNADLSGEMRKIKAPALIIASRNDELVPFYVSEAMHGLLKNSVFKVIAQDHSFPIKNPEQSAELIDSFVKENI